MNNTIETNQSYQNFKEILRSSLLSKLFQVLLLHVAPYLPASMSPNDCYLCDKQSLCTIQYLRALIKYIASPGPTDC